MRVAGGAAIHEIELSPDWHRWWPNSSHEFASELTYLMQSAQGASGRCWFTHSKGDISTVAGVADIVRQLPSPIDAFANVAGLSGSVGIVPTLAVNFYGLRALPEAVVPRNS